MQSVSEKILSCGPTSFTAPPGWQDDIVPYVLCGLTVNIGRGKNPELTLT